MKPATLIKTMAFPGDERPWKYEGARLFILESGKRSVPVAITVLQHNEMVQSGVASPHRPT